MEKWIGTAVGKMHVHKITHAQLAEKLHYSREYVTLILNEKKTIENGKERILSAIDDIIAERGG